MINESSLRVNIENDNNHELLSGIAKSLTPDYEIDREVKDKFLGEKDGIPGVRGNKTNQQKRNKRNIVPEVLDISLEDNLAKYPSALIPTSSKKKKKEIYRCSDSNLTDTPSIQVSTEDKTHDSISGAFEPSILKPEQKIDGNVKRLDEAIRSQNFVENDEMINEKGFEKDIDPEILEKFHQSCQFEDSGKEEKKINHEIRGKLMINQPSLNVTADDKMYQNLPKTHFSLTSETKVYEKAEEKKLNVENLKQDVNDDREESKKLPNKEDSLKFDDKSEEEIQLVVSEKVQQGFQNEKSNTSKSTASLMKNLKEYSCKALVTAIIETDIESNINKNTNYNDQLKAINSSMPKAFYHPNIPEERRGGIDERELKYVSLETSQEYNQPENTITRPNAIGETEIDDVAVDTTIMLAANKDEKHGNFSDAATTFAPEVISNLDTKEWNLNHKEGVEKFLNEKGKLGGNEIEKELQKKDTLTVLEKSHENDQTESDTQLLNCSNRDKKHNVLDLPIYSTFALPIYERDIENSSGEKSGLELFTNSEDKYIQSIIKPNDSLDILSITPDMPKNNSSSFLVDFSDIDEIENVSKPVSISKIISNSDKEVSNNSLIEIKPEEVKENTVSISHQENQPTDNPKSVKTLEKENWKKMDWKNLELSAITPNDIVKIEENKSYIRQNDLPKTQDAKMKKDQNELLNNTQQDDSFSISTNSEEVESKSCQKTLGVTEDTRKDLLKSSSESSMSKFGIDNQYLDDNNVQSNLRNLNTPLKSRFQDSIEIPISSTSKIFDSSSRSITSISPKSDHLDTPSSVTKKPPLLLEKFDQFTAQKKNKSFSDCLNNDHLSPLRSSRSSNFGFRKLPIVVEERHLENAEQNDRLLYQTGENNKRSTGRLDKDISYQDLQEVESNSITLKKDAYKGNIISPSLLTNEVSHLPEKSFLRNYRSFQMIPQKKPVDIRRSSSYSGNLSNKGLVQKCIEKFESSEEIYNPNKLEREIIETPLTQKKSWGVFTGLKSNEPRTRKPSQVEQGITTTVADVATKGFPATLDLDIEQQSSDLKILKPSSKLKFLQSQESQIPDHENSSRSLRRCKPQTCSDLRSLSQHKEKLGPDKPNPPQDKQVASNSAPQPNEGRVRAKDMADILDGVGEGHMTSSRSPTRPHSLRRRQSMKVMDLESKVENLVEQNRILAEEKQNIEQQIKSSLQTSLSKKDAELETLTRTLNFLQEEVSKLMEVNESLNSAASAITQQYSDRNAILESEHAKLSQELEQIRIEHKRLSSNFQNEVQSKISVKDRKIAELRAELDTAKQKIREAQKQILLSKSCDLEYLSLKYEDYFVNSCQKLCQHVQQWVLRFSKYSDLKSCRLTGEIGDDKIVERLDNAILDGSDVDIYLSDRIKRRDVFMSVVMTMIWEYIFTRYLFGMGRDQRQKLKSLEKTLSEVGPASAVHSWRAITLTLLSKRRVFVQQKEQDTQAVVDVIINTLSEILPPPSNFEKQIQEQLSRVMNEAVDLSIEMRCQKAEYMMLPPLQPEYDTNGEVLSKVLFNAAVMNERSGDTISNEELETQKAIVRIVLFPLVVKRGDDSGQTKQETVICPAQVLTAKPKTFVHRDDEARSKISLKSNSHTTKSEFSSLGLPSMVE